LGYLCFPWQWNSDDENSLFLRNNPVYIAKYNVTVRNDKAANYTDLGGGGVYTASSDGSMAGLLFIIENVDELPVELYTLHYDNFIRYGIE
jgi:hypothetical protein